MRFTLNKLIALLCAIPLAAGAQALSDKPGDYSHAMPLTVSGKQAVVQLRLPQAVYLHARSAALHDVRLFDAAGTPMPFALQAPSARQTSTRRDLPVRMFAVMGSEGGAAPLDAQLDVRRSPDGTLLSVSARAGVAARAPGALLDSLVLDLGKPDGAVDALRFTLPEGTSNYSARIALEVSDDLKHWDTVGDSEINWLVNPQAETLSSDRIEFEARSFRYARLRWRDGKPLQFARITAEAPLSTNVPAAQEKLLLQPMPGKVEGDLVYRASAAIPVQRIGLEFADQNVVLPAQLGRYTELPDPKGGATSTWRFTPVLEATFYRLSQAGAVRSSGDITITPAHVQEWVLRPANTGATTGKPALRLGWTPSSMVFLANGKAPYSLVFGRSDARPAQRALEQVAPGFSAAEIAGLESAQAGPLQVQQAGAAAGPGDAALAAQSARTRMLALWAALLAGVAVLGYMAWRLMRQMK